MSKPDGGPAFPSGPASGNWGVAFTGLSLRDYFAAQALTLGGEWFYGYGGTDHEAIAVTCYQLADAMLKAREASCEPSA